MTNEQKIDIINQSIKGIIKIINTCDKQNQIFLLKNICSKTYESIKSTKDTLQYLILLDKLKSDDKMGKIFSHIFIEYFLNKKFFFLY